jgi:hypothetical protein
MPSEVNPINPHIMKTIASLLICSLLSITVSWSQNGDYSFKETYDLATPAKMKISSSDGNIEVSPGTTKKAEVLYIVRRNNKVLQISRKELEKELKVTVVQTANSLDINVEYPKIQGLSWKDHMQVSFKITVPKETSCELVTSDGNVSLNGLALSQQCRTSDGNIAISSVGGDVTGRTSDGNISVKQITGAVEVRTSDGNIVAEDIKGNTQAVTSDGNIVLSHVTGDITISTSDGDIAFTDVSGSVKASSSDGNIRGNLIELKKSLAVRTSDGNISITIPDRLDLTWTSKANRWTLHLITSAEHPMINIFTAK